MDADGIQSADLAAAHTKLFWYQASVVTVCRRSVVLSLIKPEKEIERANLKMRYKTSTA